LEEKNDLISGSIFIAIIFLRSHVVYSKYLLKIKHFNLNIFKTAYLQTLVKCIDE